MPVGANPRSFALDAAGRLLVVGTRGGVEVFAVTAKGGLSVAAGGKLPNPNPDPNPNPNPNPNP